MHVREEVEGVPRERERLPLAPGAGEDPDDAVDHLELEVALLLRLPLEGIRRDQRRARDLGQVPPVLRLRRRLEQPLLPAPAAAPCSNLASQNTPTSDSQATAWWDVHAQESVRTTLSWGDILSSRL